MNLSLNSTNRHRLIDCGEYLSSVLGKKAATAKAGDATSDHAIDRRSTALLRRSQLKSLLARDIVR